MTPTPVPKQLLRRTLVAKRYGVTPRTIINWQNSPELGFPRAIVIRKFNYFRVEELDLFDTAQRAGEAAE
jgi:hypothetical protein